MNLFSSPVFNTLEKGLNGSALRHRTISQNIANVDTPNYKAKKVSFEHTLNEAMNRSLRAYRTDQRHFEFSTSSSEPIITRSNSTVYNHNSNNVDIDVEMADLAKNQIYYNALIERLNGSFSSLNTAIKGGR